MSVWKSIYILNITFQYCETQTQFKFSVDIYKSIACYETPIQNVLSITKKYFIGLFLKLSIIYIYIH